MPPSGDCGYAQKPGQGRVNPSDTNGGRSVKFLPLQLIKMKFGMIKLDVGQGWHKNR